MIRKPKQLILSLFILNMFLLTSCVPQGAVPSSNEDSPTPPTSSNQNNAPLPTPDGPLVVNETFLEGEMGEVKSLTISGGLTPYYYIDPISLQRVNFNSSNPRLPLPLNAGSYPITIRDSSGDSHIIQTQTDPSIGLAFPTESNFTSGLLWGLHTTGEDNGGFVIDNDIDVDLPELWRTQRDCSRFPIAIMDSGTDVDHIDLNANLWTNPGEIEGNGIDDDNNGMIDDYYGYNFSSGNSNVNDDNFHGTHVAGIIGARSNGTGVVGVCWKARIMTVKVLDWQGDGSLSDILDGYDYARENGARIVNNSFGAAGPSTSFQNTISSAINDLRNAGILIVAAAGNNAEDNDDSNATWPASSPSNNILSVASMTGTGALSSFSNYGVVAVDLAAPGSLIASTSPSPQTDYMQDPNQDGDNSDQLEALYEYSSGTSMAAPFVSATAAMIWTDNPDLTYTQVRTRILDNVDILSGLSTTISTSGKVNADKSVNN